MDEMGTLFHIFHRVFHTAGGKVCGNCAKVKNTVCISHCRFRQVGLHKFHSRKQNNRELMPQKEGCVMLKGVNKQVVEVVEVDNEFFERAILFVKPEKQQNGEEALRENARRYVGSLRWRPRQPGGWRLWGVRLAQWGSAVGLGALLGGLLIK